jgi:hypothetical protein
MLTLTATSTPNFYDVLSSNEYDHYPLLVEAPDKLICGCRGFNQWGHCYHVLEAAKMISYIPETTNAVAVPVLGAEATECTCSHCGAWMMKWAWASHLRGNFCQMYMEAAAVAAPAPVAARSSAASYSLPLVA